MNEILIPISPGELLDKITILQLKAERITDPAKVENVKTELDHRRRKVLPGLPVSIHHYSASTQQSSP